MDGIAIHLSWLVCAWVCVCVVCVCVFGLVWSGLACLHLSLKILMGVAFFDSFSVYWETYFLQLVDVAPFTSSNPPFRIVCDLYRNPSKHSRLQ